MCVLHSSTPTLPLPARPPPPPSSSPCPCLRCRHRPVPLAPPLAVAARPSCPLCCIVWAPRWCWTRASLTRCWGKCGPAGAPCTTWGPWRRGACTRPPLCSLDVRPGSQASHRCPLPHHDCRCSPFPPLRLLPLPTLPLCTPVPAPPPRHRHRHRHTHLACRGCVERSALPPTTVPPLPLEAPPATTPSVGEAHSPRGGVPTVGDGRAVTANGGAVVDTGDTGAVAPHVPQPASADGKDGWRWRSPPSLLLLTDTPHSGLLDLPRRMSGDGDFWARLLLGLGGDVHATAGLPSPAPTPALSAAAAATTSAAATAAAAPAADELSPSVVAAAVPPAVQVRSPAPQRHG
jgi:hypothetical protein